MRPLIKVQNKINSLVEIVEGDNLNNAKTRNALVEYFDSLSVVLWKAQQYVHNTRSDLVGKNKARYKKRLTDIGRLVKKLRKKLPKKAGKDTEYLSAKEISNLCKVHPSLITNSSIPSYKDGGRRFYSVEGLIRYFVSGRCRNTEKRLQRLNKGGFGNLVDKVMRDIQHTYLKQGEAVKVLHINYQEFLKKRDKGEIPYIKRGKRFLYEPKVIETLKEELSKPSQDYRKYISQPDAIRLLHITPHRFIKLRNKKKIPYTKDGVKFLYKSKDVEALRKVLRPQVDHRKYISQEGAIRILGISVAQFVKGRNAGEISFLRDGRRFFYEKKVINGLKKKFSELSMDYSNYISQKDAVKLFDITNNEFSRLRKDGKIPSVTRGHSLLYNKSTIESIVKELATSRVDYSKYITQTETIKLFHMNNKEFVTLRDQGKISFVRKGTRFLYDIETVKKELFYTFEEALDYLGISATRLGEYIDNSMIPSPKEISGKPLFLKRDVEQIKQKTFPNKNGS
jgi:hypothetical protein